MKKVAMAILLAFVPCVHAAVAPYESEPSWRMMPSQSIALDQLARAGSERPVLCSDEVFLRRVFLDVLGTLPTAQEAEAFLSDKGQSKRQQLIDRLLARPEFSEYWGMKWGDVLRVKSEFPVNLWPNAAQAYDAWIREALRSNMPYSEFARQLLTASGSNFRTPQVNFFRAAGGHDPRSLAASAARVFMGARIAGWPAGRQADLEEFFTRVSFKKTKEWKEEILVCDTAGETDESAPALRLPDGSPARLRPGADPREAFAEWLVSSPKSPFAANGANRIWFWLFGKGLVHEPDDFRPDNPPSNPALLDGLAKQFAACGYDTKQLLKIILNSDTYQSSSIKGAAAPAYYTVRKVEAEVLVDAINRITGATDEYSSVIPEPFTFIPEGTRAIEIPDGSITSASLELFGKSPRDTGLLTERPQRVTTSQRLQLLNSRSVLEKLEKSRSLAEIFRSSRDPRSATDKLYLAILSRYPTERERAVIEAYQPPGQLPPKQKFLDVAWALVNSPEFLLKH